MSARPPVTRAEFKNHPGMPNITGVHRFTDARPLQERSDERTSPTAVALSAVARLLSASTEPELLEALTDGARRCFDASGAIVLLPAGDEGRLRIATGPMTGRRLTADAHPLIQRMLDRRCPHLRAGRGTTKELLQVLTGEREHGVAMLLLLREPDGRDAVLALTGLAPPPTDTVDVSVAAAFADAGAAAIVRVKAAAEHHRQAEQQRALTRAAKQLNESLDLGTVLSRIVHEAVTILGADTSAVYRRTERGGALVDTAYGLPPQSVGWEMPPGTGLAGRVMLDGEPRIALDYTAMSGLPSGSPMEGVVAAAAAPMRWDGSVQGSLTVGFRSPRDLTQADLELLETFAELAASAYANATVHAGIVQAARTDGLTGCLNHAALHQALEVEIERCRRTDSPLSLVLLDLDHFKDVNERHGHLAGDDALRRAGAALRQTTRPYDLAARYGGDEFALVTIGADATTAVDVADRTVARVGHALGDLVGPGVTAATAGVAQWHPRQGVTELIDAADRALLWAKQENGRGRAVGEREVPRGFRPAPSGRSEVLPVAPGSFTSMEEHLRKRTRQLALANALGTRLAAMTDRAEIAAAALDELIGAFGYFSASLCELREDGIAYPIALRGEPFRDRRAWTWSVPLDAGLIGRCLRSHRPVLVNDARSDAAFIWQEETRDVSSELVVPVFVGDELWGCLNLEAVTPDAFDGDDVSLLETVAAQVGAALRSVAYYDRLERALLGTAEALAGALEAKDAYTADHAREIAEQAATIARQMGLDEAAIRDVRLAAVLHDIGKIAIPETILNKPGPLTDEEFEVVKRHTIVGEQILQPVEALAGVRPMVRHEHERWDGGGYPDGLAGEAIPLGSRIILACDALHAMTSDRPYRKALSTETAHAELRRHAGTQFDPAVIDALLGPEPSVALSAAEPPARIAG